MIELLEDRLAPATVTGVVTHTSVTEGDWFTFSIQLDQSVSQNVTVDYATSDGTATAGSDYTAVSGTLTILAGGTGSSPLSIATIDDFEGGEANPETLFLTFSNAVGATLGTTSPVTLSIADNDSVPPNVVLTPSCDMAMD
jgi:hypothetical protein